MKKILSKPFRRALLAIFLIIGFVFPSPLAIWDAVKNEQKIATSPAIEPNQGSEERTEDGESSLNETSGNVESVPDLSPTKDGVATFEATKKPKMKVVEKVRRGKEIAENHDGVKYDEKKNSLKLEKTASSIKEIAFNDQDLPVKVTDNDGHSTKAEYDKNGNPTKIADASGNVTHYQYDSEGRLVSSYVEKSTKNLGFWDRALNWAWADEKDEVVNLDYGEGDQIDQVENDETKLTYGYDEDGLVTSSSNSQGDEIQYVYDEDGDIIGRKASENKALASSGFLNSIRTFADSPEEVQDATFAYDDSGNPTDTEITLNVEEPKDAKELSFADRIMGIFPTASAKKAVQKKIGQKQDFDPLGNVKTITLGSGETIEKKYDDDDYPIGTVIKKGDNEVFEVNYQFNDDDQWTSRKDNRGNDESFSYDDNGQLVGYERNGEKTSYSYDDAGNMTQENDIRYSYDGNRLTKAEYPDGKTAEFSYDDAGNMTEKKVCENDECQKTEYSYTADNYLEKVKLPNKKEISYAYDGLRRRISKTFDGKTYRYIYDGNNLASIQNEAAETLERFVYDQDGQMISIVKNGTVYYVHKDNHGSVVSLSDENGKLVETYSYDAWGNLIQDEGKTETPISDYLYAGYFYDQDAGFYILGPRMYDPTYKRFFQKDPLPGTLEEDLSLNEYLYCENDPVNSVDPTGHKSERDNIGKSERSIIKQQRKLIESLEDDIKDWKKDIDKEKKKSSKKQDKNKIKNLQKKIDAAEKQKLKAEKIRNAAKDELQRKLDDYDRKVKKRKSMEEQIKKKFKLKQLLDAKELAYYNKTTKKFAKTKNVASIVKKSAKALSHKASAPSVSTSVANKISSSLGSVDRDIPVINLSKIVNENDSLYNAAVDVMKDFLEDKQEDIGKFFNDIEDEHGNAVAMGSQIVTSIVAAAAATGILYLGARGAASVAQTATRALQIAQMGEITIAAKYLVGKFMPTLEFAGCFALGDADPNCSSISSYEAKLSSSVKKIEAEAAERLEKEVVKKAEKQAIEEIEELAQREGDEFWKRIVPNGNLTSTQKDIFQKMIGKVPDAEETLSWSNDIVRHYNDHRNLLEQVYGKSIKSTDEYLDMANDFIQSDGLRKFIYRHQGKDGMLRIGYFKEINGRVVFASTNDKKQIATFYVPNEGWDYLDDKGVFDSIIEF